MPIRVTLNCPVCRSDSEVHFQASNDRTMLAQTCPHLAWIQTHVTRWSRSNKRRSFRGLWRHPVVLMEELPIDEFILDLSAGSIPPTRIPRVNHRFQEIEMNLIQAVAHPQRYRRTEVAGDALFAEQVGQFFEEAVTGITRPL